MHLFEGSVDYGPGGQERDFIYVDDVVSVNLWLLDHPEVTGIYNCGTGRAQSLNNVANAVIALHQGGRIEYAALPEGRYQSYTQANMDAFRHAGYTAPF